MRLKKDMKGEDGLQASAVELFRYKWPKRLIFAIPNGGSRNIIEAVKLKRTGTVAGVPDLFIPEPSGNLHGLFLETKFGYNKLTPAQLEWGEALKKRGYMFYTYWTIEAFENIVGAYFNRGSNNSLKISGG